MSDERSLPDQIEERLDALQQQVIDRVTGEPGWMMLHIFPVGDEGEPDYSFTYSIGFWPTHPEFLIVNLPQRLAYQVLATLYQRVQAGEKFVPEKVYGEVLRNFDVAIQDVPLEAQSAHFRWAEWFHQTEHGEWPFASVQMVWPDPHGRFPWEPDYAAEACPQPVFGVEAADGT